MNHRALEMSRGVTGRLERVVQRSAEKGYARRVVAAFRKLRHPQASRDVALVGTRSEIPDSIQPTYCPWGNVLERLWKAPHDTVTRNHRCRWMYELCQSVVRFQEVAQPFPGNGDGVAHFLGQLFGRQQTLSSAMRRD